MTKVVLFVFNGDPICFIHVLLNALDMNTKGYEVKIRNRSREGTIEIGTK